MSVARCRQEVDSAEFTDWQQFASHEPIGQERWDYLFATIAHKIVAVNSRRGFMPKLLDFIPQWWRSKRQKSDEEMMAIFDQMFRSMKSQAKPNQ